MSIMPALKAYVPPLEITQPGRRRVWPHPELQSHSLLVLTLDELHLAPLPGSPRPEVVIAAEAGGELDELLGHFATIIELASIQRVKLDLLTNSLFIEYSRGHSQQDLAITFATPEAADGCFSRIWRRLGEGCKLLPQQRDWKHLARTPFLLLGAVLAITALLALSISITDDFATSHAAASVNLPGDGGPVSLSPLQKAVGWMDWRVVCGLGGAAAAATQVWLYRRITQPPVSLEVLRT
ncbi:MAG TPA: hypothetical protein VN641_16885 [Urbifossiella sp.]|nr:hypothetical protein [Urbifossiella sp.]